MRVRGRLKLRSPRAVGLARSVTVSSSDRKDRGENSVKILMKVVEQGTTPSSRLTSSLDKVLVGGRLPEMISLRTAGHRTVSREP